MRLPVLAAVVVAASITLQACADDASDSAPLRETAPVGAAVSPPDLRPAATPSDDLYGLSATLQQYREDEASNRLSVKISNAGDDEIVIESLRVEWPAMEPTEPSTLDYTVFPHTRVDLRVPLAEMVCSSPPQITEEVPDVAIAAVATTVHGDITFPVTDPEGVFGRIYPRACRAQAVEFAADISLSDDWIDVSAEPPTLTGTLTIHRTGSTAPLTVEAVHGSVLINVGGDGLPATLAASDSDLEIPITATNNRCDSHALGEAKKPYLFQVDLLIGDEAVTFVVDPSDVAKSALADGIFGRCPPE